MSDELSIEFRRMVSITMAVLAIGSLWVVPVNAELCYGSYILTYAVTLGESGNDYVWGVAKTGDGFVMAGYTDSFGRNSGLAIKIKSNGLLPVVEWEELIGTDNGNEKIYDVSRIGDKYVMAGLNETGRYKGEPLVLIIDSNGTLLSSYKVSFGGAYGWIFRVTRVMNNSFLLIGYDQNYDAVALRMNNYSDVVWSKSFRRSGGYLYFYGSAFDPSNNMIYLAGNEYGKSVVVALNASDGSLLWSKEISIPASQSTVAMGLKLMGTDIIVYGYNQTGTNRDGFIIKLNHYGQPEWGYVFGTTGYEVVMDAFISNYNVYTTGYTKMGSFGGNNAFILKTNGNGSLSWFKVYGGNGNDWFYRLLISNCSIMGLGGSNSFSGNDDILLVNMTSTGNLRMCNISETKDATTINYRMTVINVNPVALTSNNLSISITPYPVLVKHIDMKEKHVCPKLAGQTVGGELLSLPNNNNVPGEALIAVSLILIPLIIISIRSNRVIKH